MLELHCSVQEVVLTEAFLMSFSNLTFRDNILPCLKNESEKFAQYLKIFTAWNMLIKTE